MAAAKKRPSPAPRFPYSARDREGGGAYAETANGRELLFTGPAGEAAKRMASARGAVAAPYAPVEPGPAVDPTFDAHAYQMAAEAANPFAMPRTARGSLRDLAPEDVPPMTDNEKRTIEAEYEMMPAGQFPAETPVLGEALERRAYVEGEPAANQQWDTVYRDPEDERRRNAAPAALPRKARVKHAEDVSWYDPEKPISL